MTVDDLSLDQLDILRTQSLHQFQYYGRLIDALKQKGFAADDPLMLSAMRCHTALRAHESLLLKTIKDQARKRGVKLEWDFAPNNFSKKHEAPRDRAVKIRHGLPARRER